ncbi:LysR family transcriptional regulator, partial [Pseudomonas aeruginosa]
RVALYVGRLHQLLPEWWIPGLGIFAVTPRRDAQPAKV